MNVAEIRNMPVFNQQSPKPKPTANSSTEIEIDPTTLPGYQSIPDNCPGWKVAMIEKKNSDLVEKAKEELLKQKAEEDKWKDVPDWRKALIQKKEEKKQQEEAGHMEQKKKEDERNARLQAMPEWKRKIILKKSGDEL